jgi:hypothetical protein
MNTDAILNSRRTYLNRACPGLLVASICSLVACPGAWAVPGAAGTSGVATSAAKASDGTTLVAASFGQPIRQRSGTSDAGSNGLCLVNSTKAKLNVELSDKPDSGWKTVSLDKDATMTDSRLRYIRIGTLRGKVNRMKTYDLQGGAQRYSLVWNKKHRCWDVWSDQAQPQEGQKQQPQQAQSQLAQAQEAQPQQAVKLAQRQ